MNEAKSKTGGRADGRYDRYSKEELQSALIDKDNKIQTLNLDLDVLKKEKIRLMKEKDNLKNEAADLEDQVRTQKQ